jgi:hypothetical protein
LFPVNLPESDLTFLRDLVKTARQKPHSVQWTDRDGTERTTTLSQADVIKLNQAAARLKVSKSEILRQAARIPVAKNPPPESGAPAL